MIKCLNCETNWQNEYIFSVFFFKFVCVGGGHHHWRHHIPFLCVCFLFVFFIWQIAITLLLICSYILYDKTKSNKTNNFICRKKSATYKWCDFIYWQRKLKYISMSDIHIWFFIFQYMIVHLWNWFFCGIWNETNSDQIRDTIANTITTTFLPKQNNAISNLDETWK